MAPCPAAVRIWRSSAALMLAGCLGLGACALETGHRPVDPALLKEVQRFYHDHAFEQGGACRSPSMDEMQASSVEARSEQRMIVRVRYVYRQRAGGANAAACRGTGERVFRLERRAAGWQVVQMSGPGRPGPGALFRLPFG
jgi:hypothetical protein